MAGLFSFRGGVHPPGGKHLTAHKAIVTATAPRTVTIPLQQHIGEPCRPLVQPGDYVQMGQMIGEGRPGASAPVHASVSGTVAAVEVRPHPTLEQGLAIVIASDGQDTWIDYLRGRDLAQMTPADIVAAVYAAGIVGLGGAAFPTHRKLTLPPGKQAATVVLNGAECEPYLTADHRLLLEQAPNIVFGLKSIMQALGAKEGWIGIENNKPDAIRAMQAAVKAEPNLRVAALRTKYPQGAEKQLITAVTGREVPGGGLPADVGVVVNNVGTAVAVAQALRTGRPLIERVVTVTGSLVREPQNLLVRLGTSFADLIEQCGGTTAPPAKVVAGGPMMGVAQPTLTVPVVKGTSGILVLSAAEAAIPPVSDCIRCGKCVAACPMHLMPLSIDALSLKGDYPACGDLNAMDCIECGACSYVCPAKRPLAENIRQAKAALRAAAKRN